MDTSLEPVAPHIGFANSNQLSFTRTVKSDNGKSDSSFPIMLSQDLNNSGGIAFRSTNGEGVNKNFVARNIESKSLEHLTSMCCPVSDGNVLDPNKVTAVIANTVKGSLVPRSVTDADDTEEDSSALGAGFPLVVREVEGDNSNATISVTLRVGTVATGHSIVHAIFVAAGNDGATGKSETAWRNHSNAHNFGFVFSPTANIIAYVVLVTAKDDGATEQQENAPCPFV